MANEGPIAVPNPNNTMNSPLCDTVLVSCPLKRKRPPKIEIPIVLREIPTGILTGRAAQKRTVSVSGSGVAVLSVKGKRMKRVMEDSHKIFSSLNGDKGFFGVYDGHGGSKAAEFVADNLHLNIFEKLEFLSETKAKEEAIKAGYLKTDEDFLKQGIGSGSCCVTALIEGKELIVSNLGDCRAVLCRNGIAEALTRDHRPSLEDEQKRIVDKGGYVGFHGGTLRINGALAVSRSIGDSYLKNWVVADPETKVVFLTPDMEYLILASDGLWDEVSNQEVVNTVMQTCSHNKKDQIISPEKKENENIPYPFSSCISPISKSPRFSLVRSKSIEIYNENGSPPSKSRRISMMKQMKIISHSPRKENEVNEKPILLAACKELVDLAITRGSLDDITVMIVDLNHYKGSFSSS